MDPNQQTWDSQMGDFGSGANSLGTNASSGGSSSGGNSNFLSSMMQGGLPGDIASLFSGFEGQGASPFNAAASQYQKWAQQGANAINPYNQAGQQATSNLANWATGMKDPSAFVNTLMNKYQESPTAKYMQQQALRAAQNEGSASGTVGSTPYTMQNEQNAENISQQDQNNWLQNVLGVNTQYGNTEGNIMNAGENGANSLLNLYGQEAGALGDAAYGAQAGQNQDQNQEESGLSGIASDVGQFFGI